MRTKLLFTILLSLTSALSGCYQSSNAANPSAASSGTVTAGSSLESEEERIVRVRNWPKYLPEGVLEQFEFETGIKVDYKTFASNEDLLATVAKGSSDADIVVPGSPFAALMIEKGLIRPIDKNLVPNAKHLDPLIMKLLRIADPGNSHLIPWAWGFTTIGINRQAVAKALGETPFPQNAWDLVFNPVYTSKLKSCGIGYLDSPSEVIPAAAHYAGRAAYSNNPDDHAAAAQVIKAVRGDIKTFSSHLVEDLAAGKLCATLGWSGDINQSAQQAVQAGAPYQIEALLPSTGGVAFFDTMVILKSGKHPKNAHAFINFMLRPEIAARVIAELGYPTGNMAARPLVDTKTSKNPSVFLSEEDVNKLAVPAAYTMVARASMATHYVSSAYGVPIAGVANAKAAP